MEAGAPETNEESTKGTTPVQPTPPSAPPRTVVRISLAQPPKPPNSPQQHDESNPSEDSTNYTTRQTDYIKYFATDDNNTLFTILTVQSKILRNVIGYFIASSVFSIAMYAMVVGLNRASYGGLKFHPGNNALFIFSIFCDLSFLFMIGLPVKGWKECCYEFGMVSMPRVTLQVVIVSLATGFSNRSSRVVGIFAFLLAQWTDSLKSTQEPERFNTMKERQSLQHGIAFPVTFCIYAVSGQYACYEGVRYALNVILWCFQVYVLRLLQRLVKSTKGLDEQIEDSSAVFISTISCFQTLLKILRFSVAGKSEGGTTRTVATYWAICTVQILFDRILPRMSRIIIGLRKLKLGKLGKRLRTRKVGQSSQVMSTTNVDLERKGEAPGGDIDDAKDRNDRDINDEGITQSMERMIKKQETIKKMVTGEAGYSVSKSDHTLCSYISTIVAAVAVYLIELDVGFPDYTVPGLDPNAAGLQEGSTVRATLPKSSPQYLATVCAVYFALEVLIEVLFLGIENMKGIPVLKTVRRVYSHQLVSMSMSLGYCYIAFYAGATGFFGID
ncbi:hypothetical protein HDU97_002884 [Phlyctochytrium planicorne]|nr:hypothetical protein HDU97_002884 [Phlyctochytrium planicorne]